MELAELLHEITDDAVDLLDHGLGQDLDSTPISTVATGPCETLNPGSSMGVTMGISSPKVPSPPRALTADFRGRVRDLFPEDRGEAFVADLPAADEDVGVEGDDLVLTEAAPRAADVAHDDAEATAGDEDAKALLPDLVELWRKCS